MAGGSRGALRIIFSRLVNFFRSGEKEENELAAEKNAYQPDDVYDDDWGEIVVPIEDVIDLHTYHPGDVKSLLEEYIPACIDKGVYEIRIIHGKGKGVQRRIVHSLLSKHPDVASFQTAGPEAGGWGATVARLMPRDVE